MYNILNGRRFFINGDKITFRGIDLGAKSVILERDGNFVVVYVKSHSTKKISAYGRTRVSPKYYVIELDETVVKRVWLKATTNKSNWRRVKADFKRAVMAFNVGTGLKSDVSKDLIEAYGT